MNLGLLGALGGLGKGMQQFGQSLFDDQLAQQREARLQAIRDKEYARGREDSLADYQMQRTDQLEDAQTDRDFRKGLVNDEREYNAGQLMQIVKGDDGELLGINQDGTSRNLGSVTVDDDTLSEYMRSYNRVSAYLQAEGASPDDPAYADDFQLRRSLIRSINERLGSANPAANPGISTTPPRRADQAAMDYLKENPDEIDLFESRYGYRPGGF